MVTWTWAVLAILGFTAAAWARAERRIRDREPGDPLFPPVFWTHAAAPAAAFAIAVIAITAVTAP